MWTQHLLVLLLVGGCTAFVAWQGLRSLSGRKSKIGCACKSCPVTQSARPEGKRIVFLPVESLQRRGR